MSEDLVSVIIPVHNTEDFLEETLTSVVQQSYLNLEIIVVDDGSTDSSRDIIKRFEQTDSRVKSIFQENAGVSRARNVGFATCKGHFIAFLDADDVWKPDNIERKIELLTRSDFGMVHSNAGFIDANSDSIEGELVGREGDLLDSMLLWEGPSVPGPSSILLRRSVLKEIGNFDEDLSTAADMDIFIRIASKYSIGHLNLKTWLYRIHDGNMHGNIQKMQDDILKVYRKVDKSNMFESRAVRRKAYGVMYRILGASWIGDGKKPAKGLYYMIRSLLIYPAGLPLILKRGGRKLRPS